MNLKRFISGISAFAIAASAFAGLAVTAGAEAVTNIALSQDFSAEGSATTFNKPVYGKNESSGKAEYKGTEEFSAYSVTEYGFKQDNSISNAGRSIAFVDDGKLTIIAASDGGSDRGLAYKNQFDAIGSGNEITVSYKWEMGSATGTNGRTQTYLADASGNKVLDISYTGQDQKLYVNTSNPVKTSVARSQTVTVSATINMNTQKITSLSVGNIYSASDLDFANSNATTVSQFAFKHQTRATTWANTSSIDDISITYKAIAGEFSVTYKSGETVFNSQNVDLTGKYVGDSVSYKVPAYINSSGTLYKATGLGTTKSGGGKDSPYLTNYTPSVTLQSENDDIIVNYEAQSETIYQYEDFDSSTSDGGIGRMWIYSNGAYRVYNSESDSDNTINALTVEKDGIYSIESNVGSSKNGATVKITLLAAGKEVDSSSYYNRGGVLSGDGIALRTGDVISLKSDVGTFGVDYVLIKKTADLPAETDPTYGEIKTAYSGTVGDGVHAVAKYFTVNTGSGTKSKIKVAVEGQSDEKALSQVTDANVVFGILLESKTKTDDVLANYDISISFE